MSQVTDHQTLRPSRRKSSYLAPDSGHTGPPPIGHGPDLNCQNTPLEGKLLVSNNCQDKCRQNPQGFRLRIRTRMWQSRIIGCGKPVRIPPLHLQGRGNRRSSNTRRRLGWGAKRSASSATDQSPISGMPFENCDIGHALPIATCARLPTTHVRPLIMRRLENGAQRGR